MKIQDLVFIAILVPLLFKMNPKWFAVAGIVSLVLSIPLFSFWVFFTAQRLTYYAAAFFLAAIVLYLIQSRKR